MTFGWQGMISFYLKPTPQPQRTSCELHPRRLQVVSTGNGNFWSKISKVQPNWCSSGENTIKTRNTISSPVPQAIIPETSLPRWNDSFRPENRFPSYLSTIPPQSQSSSFFPLLLFPATLVWTTRHQSHLPCMGVEEGFSLFFFKAVKSFTIYLWEWRKGWYTCIKRPRSPWQKSVLTHTHFISNTSPLSCLLSWPRSKVKTLPASV